MTGLFIPVPGYAERVDSPFSILQLGLASWAVSIVFIKIINFVLFRKCFNVTDNSTFFRKPVLLSALVITFAQGWALSHTQYYPLYDDGSMPLILVLVSYLAGSVICFYLGFVIQRYGTGAGFWTMMAAAGMMEFFSKLQDFFQIDPHVQGSDLGKWIICVFIPFLGFMMLSLSYRLNSRYTLHCWAWPILVVMQIFPLTGIGTYYLGTFFKIDPFHLYHIVLSLALLVAVLVSLPPHLPSLLRWLSVPALAVFLASEYFSTRLFNFYAPMLPLLTTVLTVSAITFIFFEVSERVQHNRHVKSLKL